MIQLLYYVKVAIHSGTERFRMSDVPRVRYILPKFSNSDYGRVMKTLNNSFEFGVSEKAKYRLHVLDHYYQYGYKSTCSAFKVSKSTLYEWKKRYEDSKKNLRSLIPFSTKPKNLRYMQIDWRLVECIKHLRQKRYKISKYKLKPFVDEYAKYLDIPSIGTSTIGKIIKRKDFFYDNKKLKRKTKFSRGRIKKSPKSNKPGYIEIDCITIYVGSKKHYFVSIIDIHTKFAHVKKVPTLSSNQAKLAFIEFKELFQYKIKVVQTDNGSEFLLNFHKYLEENNIKHIFIYPRCPKINGVVERFNRTIQEECIEYTGSFWNDPDQFSTDLKEYLNWYNYQRPHASLNYMSPVNYLKTNFPECMQP